MTPEQYERWKDFAFRMCENGLTTKSGKRLPKASREKVRERIEWFFEVGIENNYGEELIPRIVDWDTTDPSGQTDKYGHDYGSPYVCDIVQDVVGEGFNPYYWAGNESQAKYEAFDELWGNRVSCCIRAGLDMAASPSAGVGGFTAGDLRRMYPEGVPDWIVGDLYLGSPFKPIPEGAERADFSSIPDDMGVWL